MNTCIDAFKNIYLETRNNQINISPCCVSDYVTVKAVDFYHSHLENIRDSWRNGKFPAECLYCKKAEDSNTNSRRLGSNKWYEDNNLLDNNTDLIRIDYWVGDTCNLACLICGPQNSSRWKQENSIPIQNFTSNVNKAWQKLDLSKLKFIHFNGGEPLLSKEHLLFLENIPVPSDVHINYNTNGTISPSTKLIKIWEKFKLVQIDFSIDDIEERFEIQRYPANWSEVVSNLNWFYKHCPVNCMFSINTTISVLNQGNIENIKKWFQTNFASNRVTDPVEHRFQLVTGIFSPTFALKNKQKIIYFLDKLDEKRGTNWRKVLPDVYKILSLNQF